MSSGGAMLISSLKSTANSELSEPTSELWRTGECQSMHDVKPLKHSTADDNFAQFLRKIRSLALSTELRSLKSVYLNFNKLHNLPITFDAVNAIRQIYQPNPVDLSSRSARSTTDVHKLPTVQPLESTVPAAKRRKIRPSPLISALSALSGNNVHYQPIAVISGRTTEHRRTSSNIALSS